MNRAKSLEIFQTAPIPKAVMSNVIPAIISMIMVLLYNLADTYFIGQTGDPLKVAAVSLATPVFLIFLAVGLLFGIGGTSFISRSLGEGNDKAARHASSFCFWAGIAVGVISAILIFVFAEPICRAAGATDDTLEYTMEYMRIVTLGIPFLILSNTFSNIIRSEGHAKTAMTGMIVGNLVNIILDPIMILGFGWGVAGAAIATALGNIFGSGFYIVHLLSKRSMLSIKLSDYKSGGGIAKGVLAIGIPASLNGLLMSTSNIIVNNIMSDYGSMAVAGLGVAMKVNMIAVILLIGLGTGVQPMLGFCFGARMKKRYLDALKFSILIALLLSAIMTFICYTFAGPLVTAFLKDQEAYAYGFKFSRIYVMSGPVIGLLFVMINAIQSMGATVPSLILSVSRQGIIYMPILFIFNAIFQNERAAAMAQPVTDYISTILAVILFIITFKKSFKNYESEG